MEEIGLAKLYNTDCLKLDLEADAVVSDPPYGGDYDTNYDRFTKGVCKHHKFDKIKGDDKPFDPTPWLKYETVLLFGYQHFANKLPLGTILVWQKKRNNKLGTFCSDAELIWFNRGQGVFLFSHVWDGFDRESEKLATTFHPTQKPAVLMKWCIEKLNLPANSTILDPYMGSGSTGVAAVQMGYRFIGVEIEKPYFDLACDRIRGVQKKKDLFV